MTSASIASAVVITGANVVVVVLVWIEGIETPAGEVPPRHREVVGQVDTFEDTWGT